MIKQLIHLVLLFWIILDPIGNVPIFVVFLKNLNPKRQRFVILREMLIALGILVLFLFFGATFFKFLNIDTNSLEITGGIILILIAIPMIFSHPDKENLKAAKEEPFIVPLAVPAVAGPGILAAITLYGSGVEGSQWLVLIAVVIAWLFSLPILLLAPFLKKRMGDNGLRAVEHLFGYLLVLIAAQMILHGLVGVFG